MARRLALELPHPAVARMDVRAVVVPVVVARVDPEAGAACGVKPPTKCIAGWC